MSNQSNEDVVPSTYDDHGAYEADLLRDANRYRWLRARGPMDPITVESITCCFLGGNDLDVAVDTEMAKEDRRNKTALEVVARLRKWQDDSIAGQVLKAAADLIERQIEAAPIAIGDQLAESARAYAGDVGLSRPHPLWSAIEAYENARATSPDVPAPTPLPSNVRSLLAEAQRNCSCPCGDCRTCEAIKAVLAEGGAPVSACAGLQERYDEHLRRQCSEWIHWKWLAADAITHARYLEGCAFTWHRLVEAVATILEVNSNLGASEIGPAIAEAIQKLRAVPETGEKPAGVGNEFDAIKRAMHADPEYGWSWHCNIAMPILDARLGITPSQANLAAAHVMQHLFRFDPRTQCKEWQWGQSPVKSEGDCSECDYYRSTGLGSCKKCGRDLVHCPKCKTALAFEGDVCGLCFPVAQP